MRFCLKLASLGALMLLAPSQVSAAEVFYERLLQQGIRAYGDGNTAGAVQDLTLACFGLLEEPESLMTCRSHLALAQAAAGDKSKFTETFDRILNLESRFQVYRKARMTSTARQAFEGHLAEWVPFASLNSVPAFAHIAHQKRELELMTMSLEDRRTALTAMLAENSDNLIWQIHMAEVELDIGQAQDAFDRANAVLQKDTELLVAICVRGEAQAALNNCAEALRDLAICEESGSRPKIVKQQLVCQMELQNWDAARQLYQTLPNADQRSREGRTWDKDIKRGQRDADRNAPPADPAIDSSVDGEDASSSNGSASAGPASGAAPSSASR